MAQGRIIPMVDMARLFAKRGVLATIITTPFNAARMKTTVDQVIESGLPIQQIQLPFPSREAGLPDGCENFDSIPSLARLARKTSRTVLRRDSACPKLYNFRYVPPMDNEDSPQTRDTKACVPGRCCFALLFAHNLHQYRPFESVASEHEPFVVLGLHHRIEITKAQCPIEIVGQSYFDILSNRIQEADCTSYGVVSNSFYELEPDELEPEYVEKYQKAIGKKVWTIGPVSLCNKETSDKAARGNKASISESQCLTWLNSKEENYVVYACFGSASYVFPSQLMEIGLGLEASNQPFIWVIRRSNDMSTEVENWLDGLVERVQARSLIIRGWAPQMLILSHPVIGGFLTHCGWNSTSEGICAGVQMVTLPIFSEQF
ncbi:UDP-glycosyltransferase 73D1 [Cinnamomum micranthum f. kanehirae]|uniref:UDP-glycosyltransferase 73D1 n=1 Tax=Cinnamomum micranthum f. kanehirae TaxID=337451 RepID=A0A3S3P5I0_9MAGN|nr:UDP-glycosyltransferase 73D1 [Cinnamomum micranthum f. kanehirae]